jgi:uncharacterized membrane protein YkoI
MPGSVAERHTFGMIRFLRLLTLTLPALAGAGGIGHGVAYAQAARRECLSQSETLQTIGQRHLIRPGEALASAAGRAAAEPVGAKLCRWDDRHIYEITLLRSDGRVLRVFVDAADGRQVDAPR